MSAELNKIQIGWYPTAVPSGRHGLDHLRLRWHARQRSISFVADAMSQELLPEVHCLHRHCLRRGSNQS
jgi:hypothetical protein